MGFHRVVTNWVTCDLCDYTTPKDDGTKDAYLHQYLTHLKINHAEFAKNIIKDLEDLLKPFEPYKVRL